MARRYTSGKQLPNAMPRNLSRTQSAPIAVPRSKRPHAIRNLTSLPAGKMVPIHAMPLLREDALERCQLRLSFEMMETVEILMNAVNVNVKAYLVPHLAYDRFNGMDQLNRSFSGEPDTDGGTVTPYFSTAVIGAVMPEILTYLGKHAKEGSPINMSYIEAYNAIWNFRATNRSPDIPLRNQLSAQTLAPAFWQHEQFSEIVPIFDQAIIDGEVALNVIGGQLPVKSHPGTGIKVRWPATAPTNQSTMNVGTTGNVLLPGAAPGSSQPIALQDVSGIFAELADNGITVSLSNIELARKTQAFARLRQQFSGLEDEYIVDMLMDGLTIPEQAWQQPILLAERSTVFGMSKRYSSTSGALTESVVNGMTYIDMTIRCPRVPMGGVVMVVAEITPEQLFERQKDPYLALTDPEDMPHYLRDTLDPEKVEVVQNDYIDVAHTVPAGTFGYAPLHHKWAHTAPNIGGKFYRPEVDGAFDEVRQRIWAVETVDPVLSSDFYLCNNMHQKPFVVTDQDPFECVTRGEAVISGITVFGARLVEGKDDWDEVMEEVDNERIQLPADTTTGAANDDAVTQPAE